MAKKPKAKSFLWN